MSKLCWLFTGLITGMELVGFPGFAQTITPSPELKKKELESSSHPPEVQKIEAESQQLQIPGQPTLRPLEQGEVRFDF